MKGWLGGQLARHAVALPAVAVAIGGTAFAADELTDSASKKTVRACVTKKTGKVRVLLKSRAKCKRKGEVTLTWARLGPRGTAGPTGPSGAPGSNGTNGTPGAPGAIGPSNAYIKTDASSGRGIGTTNTRLVTLRNLPAGSYLVHAEVPLAPYEAGSGTNSVRVFCQALRLSDGAEVAYNQTDIVYTKGSRMDAPPVALTGPATLTGTDDIGLECRDFAGPTDVDTGFSVTLTATRVGALEKQPYSALDP